MSAANTKLEDEKHQSDRLGGGLGGLIGGSLSGKAERRQWKEVDRSTGGERHGAYFSAPCFQSRKF